MSGFEKSVFINCPLDEEYRPIFQAVFFCVIYLGFCPRVSTETISSFDVRIRKIQDSEETLGRIAGPEKIWDSLSEFLGWHERELLRRGYFIDDIDDCPIGELTGDIKYWIETESKK